MAAEAFGPIDPRVVARYRSPGRRYAKEFCCQLIGDLRGKTLLDVGCGEGENSVHTAVVLRLPMLDRLGGIAVLHGHAPQR
jgi:2-polyprenyl-3-methyl-5-hydroxy-6-metoxy-1,4-benzoquinol methylase